MRKLPIGIQSFENLRKNNYVYVDKTKYIWELTETGKVYFLSRPRRFGKSLFLSTLKAYFEGKKELFQGLSIESLENKKRDSWISYPVIHISFAAGDYTEPEELSKKIRGILQDNASAFHISLNPENTYGDQFLKLIREISEKTGRNVAVLVDEYDKPLLDNLSVNSKQEDLNRNMLKGFFGALKDADQYLKFVLITGVTKFSKVSIFSDLNQLNDISLMTQYAGICGITEGELEENFADEIEELAGVSGFSKDVCIRNLQKRYDGYHFSEGEISVYNPFSLLNCFYKHDFGMYWFETGTPTYLIRKMQDSDYTLQDFSEGVGEDEMAMSNFKADDLDLIPLFYQSGYLTIQGYDRDGHLYSLGFPNEEVEFGFEKSLVPYILKGDASKRYVLINQMVNVIRTGDAETFLRQVQSLFASIPYPEGQTPYLEREWQNQLYLLMKLLGQRVSAEIHSSTGRADCILETEKYIYIFEFKQDKTAIEALQQIEDNRYALPYENSGKKIIKIGANFSTKIRTIDEWEIWS